MTHSPRFLNNGQCPGCLPRSLSRRAMLETSATGFGSLASISALTAADIAKLDEDLKLGGRIERDEWVEQANELLAGKPPRAKTDKEAAAKAENE